MSRDRTNSVPGFKRWAPLLAVAIAPGLRALAQDDGPIVITSREEFEFLRIEDVRLSFEFLARRQVDEVDPAAGPKTRDTEDLFRETLEATAEGYIGHPNLVQLDLAGSFRLEQETFDFGSTGTNQRISNDLYQYDVSALFLREGDSPLTIFSRRSQTTLDRQFSGSLESTVDEYGVSLTLRGDVMPSRFQFRHRVEDQTNQIGFGEFSLEQDTFEWQSTLRPDDGQLLTWDYSYDNVDQSGALRRQTAFERHDALAIHDWDFGPDELRHNMRSTVKLFKETGDFPLDRVRIDETLRLRHDRDFETRYDYAFDLQDRADTTQSLHRGSVGFRHNLFESLITTGQVGVSFLDLSFPDFRSDQRFGSLDFDYTKQVSGGRFSATAAMNLNWQDDSERGVAVQIIDESRVFSAGDLIEIRRQNIEPGSIVVTNGAGIIVYIEGLDYQTRFFTDRVEIRRVLGGSIVSGELVLVDYRIGPEPANTTTTAAYGVTIRYDIEEGPLAGIGLYARYREQRQDRERVGPGFLEDDIRDLVLGVDYDFWRISLNAEYEQFDSSLSPFEATRLEARYVESIGRGSGLTISASYDEIDRREENIQTSVTYLSGRWHQKLSNELDLNLEIIWRDESDSAGVDVEAFEQRLDLEWRYRQTIVFASVRNAFINSDAVDSTFQAFQLGFRREF